MENLEIVTVAYALFLGLCGLVTLIASLMEP